MKRLKKILIVPGVITALPLLAFSIKNTMIDHLFQEIYFSKKQKYLIVKEGARYGMLDASYGTAIQTKIQTTKYSFLDYPSDGRVRAQYRKKFMFLTTEGKAVTGTRFDYALNFSEGMAAVLVEGKWGYINQFGKMVIEPKFQSAFPFSKDGLARVIISSEQQVLGQTGFITKSGKFKLLPHYDSATNFVDSESIAEYKNKIGILKPNGSWKIKPKYDDIGYLHDELRRAAQKESWGYIDNDGKKKINFDYSDARDFSEGYAAVRKKRNRLFGYINKDGRQKITPRFKIAFDFHQGRARVAMAFSKKLVKKAVKIEAPADKKNKRLATPKILYGLVSKNGTFALSASYLDAYYKDGYYIIKSYPYGYYAILDKSKKVLRTFNEGPIRYIDKETFLQSTSKGERFVSVRNSVKEKNR